MKKTPPSCKGKVRICFGILMCLMCGCREQIVHNLSETQVNRLISKLSDHFVSAAKEKQPDGKWALSVESTESMPAVRFLMEQHLLKESNIGPKEKSSIISSREEQRFQFERDLSNEIEETLENVPAVLEARVHLNLPAIDPLFGRPLNSQPGSGSVVLVVESLSIDQSEVAQIVSGASGIPKDFIMVSIKQNVPSEKKGIVGRQFRNNEPLLTSYQVPIAIGALLLVVLGIAAPFYHFKLSRS